MLSSICSNAFRLNVGSISKLNRFRVTKRYASDSPCGKKSPVPVGSVYAAIPTSFAADGSLALKDMVYNIQRWNQTKMDGILVLGTSGEASSLSFTEKVAVLKTVKESALPRMQLFAGTGTSSLKETQDLTQVAQELCYDAALVITPYFNIASINDAALEAYYTQLADHSSIPIMLYNNPKQSGVTLSVPLIKKLALHPNITGIKDSSGNVEQIAHLVQETANQDFHVLGANGSTYLSTILSGSPGCIMALGSIVPNTLAKIHELVEAGDIQEAVSIQRQLVALNYNVSSKYGIPALKYMLTKMGYKVGAARSPLAPLGEKEIALCDKLYHQYNSLFL